MGEVVCAQSEILRARVRIVGLEYVDMLCTQNRLDLTCPCESESEIPSAPPASFPKCPPASHRVPHRQLSTRSTVK